MNGFLFSVLFISALNFVISLLLVVLNSLCSCLSRFFRCKIRRFIWDISTSWYDHYESPFKLLIRLVWLKLNVLTVPSLITSLFLLPIWMTVYLDRAFLFGSLSDSALCRYLVILFWLLVFLLRNLPITLWFYLCILLFVSFAAFSNQI